MDRGIHYALGKSYVQKAYDVFRYVIAFPTFISIAVTGLQSVFFPSAPWLPEYWLSHFLKLFYVFSRIRQHCLLSRGKEDDMPIVINVLYLFASLIAIMIIPLQNYRISDLLEFLVARFEKNWLYTIYVSIFDLFALFGPITYYIEKYYYKKKFKS